MKYFLILIAGLLINGVTQADIISRNVILKYSDVQVVDNYSAEKESGLIRIKLCSNCNAKKLRLDENSILIFEGEEIALSSLLYTRLKHPSKAVRIQFNNLDNTVSYIRWSQSEEQEKGLL